MKKVDLKTSEGPAKAKRAPHQAPEACGRTENGLLRLQRGLGNRGLGALLDGQLQRQGAPEEEEVQTQPEEEEIQTQEMPEEEEEVQTQEEEGPPSKTDSPRIPDHVMRAIDSRRGSGQELEGDVRQRAEGAFGYDFKDVRVHTDSEADRLSRGLHAKAFTKGKDVFFRGKEFAPHSAAGRELIGHELTHVVQQHVGLSEPAGRPGDRYEQEADRVAAAVFGKEAAPAAGALQGHEALLGGQVQNQPEEEELQTQEVPEEEVQMQAEEEEEVQTQAEEEEEIQTKAEPVPRPRRGRR